MVKCGLVSEGISISTYPPKNVQNHWPSTFKTKVKNSETVFFEDRPNLKLVSEISHLYVPNNFQLKFGGQQSEFI